MGHIPCNKRRTFPSQEITRISYLLQQKIYSTWALYFFEKYMLVLQDVQNFS